MIGIIFCLGFGFGNTALRVVFNTTLMELTPKSYIGRCMAVWMLIANLMLVVATFISGQLVEVIVPNWAYGLLAIYMGVAALATNALRRRVKKLISAIPAEEPSLPVGEEIFPCEVA